MTEYSDIPRDGDGKPIAAEITFPVRYELLTPLEAETRPEPVTELEVREPKAAEAEIANRERSPTATTMRLVSMASGLSIGEVRGLGLRDYMRLSELLLDFS